MHMPGRQKITQPTNGLESAELKDMIKKQRLSGGKIGICNENVVLGPVLLSIYAMLAILHCTHTDICFVGMFFWNAFRRGRRPM